MRWISRAFFIVLAAIAPLGAAMAQPTPLPGARSMASDAKPVVTILISIDGFRADYLDREVTPNLNALVAKGISAAMRPSFPSITFPNHYTLVTGLRPDRSGIVGNRMEDTRKPGTTFTMATDDPFWWTEAEPLWITAERAGIRTATMFWPGSNIDWKGARPQDWQMFSGDVNERQRVDAIIDWLRRPAETRPKFLTLYFDLVDHAGHEFGPDDPRTTAAVADADAAIGRLQVELAKLGQRANLVIVADHGMAGLSPDRLIPLYKILPAKLGRVVTDGPYAGIEPMPGKAAKLAKLLATPRPHMTCWAKADIPVRLAYGKNPRVPAFICLAEVGWFIQGQAPRPDKPFKLGGAHGYDNDSPEMRALFIAAGPAIKPVGKLPTFDNVDIAPLLRDLIGLSPGQGLDGNDTPFAGALGK